MIYHIDSGGVRRKAVRLVYFNPCREDPYELKKLFVGDRQVFGPAYKLVWEIEAEFNPAVQPDPVVIPVDGKYRITCVGRGGLSYDNGVPYPPSDARVAGGGSGGRAVAVRDLTAGTALIIDLKRKTGEDMFGVRVSIAGEPYPLCLADDGQNAWFNTITGLAVGGTGGGAYYGDTELSSRGNEGTEAHIPDDIGEMHGNGGKSVSDPFEYGAGETCYLNTNGFFVKNVDADRGRTKNGLVRIERIVE